MNSIPTQGQTVFPTAMSYPLRIRIRRQGYAFTRRDALEFGAADEQLRTWCRSGDVSDGGQGAYYLPCAVADPACGIETDRRRIRAILLALGEEYGQVLGSGVRG